VTETHTDSALNGVHGWANVGSGNGPPPLKLAFLDGRVTASMAGQLLPRVRLDPRPWWWGSAEAARSAVTALLEVHSYC